MLFRGSNRDDFRLQSPEPPSPRESPCTVCGVPVAYRTNPATCCKPCAKLRRKESLRKAAEVQRRKRGVAPVKGTEAKCDNCPAVIIRVTRTHRLCEVCSPAETLRRARETSARNARARGAPQIGDPLFCRHCGQDYRMRKSRNYYCKRCSELSVANKLPHNRAGIARWHRTKLATDARFAINSRMRCGVRHSLNGAKAGRPWEALVGYTAVRLMRHLERQFLPGMTWENRGLWQIDHIQPLAGFHFASTDDPEFRAAWALSNLRPLWSEDNYEKRAKRVYLI